MKNGAQAELAGLRDLTGHDGGEIIFLDWKTQSDGSDAGDLCGHLFVSSHESEIPHFHLAFATELMKGPIFPRASWV